MNDKYRFRLLSIAALLTGLCITSALKHHTDLSVLSGAIAFCLYVTAVTETDEPEPNA